jgi:hypothetical protein
VKRLRVIDAAEVLAARAALANVGFCELRQVFSDEIFGELQSEVIAGFDGAHFAKRDGATGYEAFIADFGPGVSAYHADHDLHALLTALTDRRFRLQENKSCVTYYLDGCFLGVHRDQIDGPIGLSVISYFWSTASTEDPSRSVGLRLNLHGNGAMPTDNPVSTIFTREASVVIGYGTHFWHGRPQLAPMEKVIASTGSFFSC